jgi:hypothetical protein
MTLYKVELKYLGKTIYKFQRDMTEEEMEKAKQDALDKFAKNRFTKNLMLDVEVTEL